MHLSGSVHVLMVFWANNWRLTASTCDSDQSFLVNCFVSGCFAEVSSTEVTRQDTTVVLPKL